MDTKPIRFERFEGRRPIMSGDDEAAFIKEGRLIRQADERDGTNAFLETAFDETLAKEPEYIW